MQAADLVIRGGVVRTMDIQRSVAGVIAVTDGRVSALGDDAEGQVGPGTRIIELESGAAVLPGFIDAHTHYIEGPMTAAGVDLTECDTLDEIIAVLREAPTDEGVVRGGGWRTHIFPTGPDRRTLDDLFGATPVLLRDISCHSLWVNSAVLTAAGITAATPDPEPGYSTFARDEDGEPTGWVLEEEAMGVVRSAVSPFTPEVARQDLLAAQAAFAGAGLTGVFDAGVFMIDERATWEMVVGLDEAGEIGQRIVAAKAAIFDDDPVAVLQAVSEEYRSPNLRIDTLKIFMDGVPESHTSAYLEPYADRPDTCGPLAAPEEVIRAWTLAADAAGFSCHFHAIGDRAVRTALDAVGEARAVNGSDVVHTICHGDTIDPADLPRFAELGVVLNTSGQWIAMTPTYDMMTGYLGDRAARMYPLRSALQVGATVTLGADYPASAYVSTFRPLVLIESAVTRRLAGLTSGDPLPPVSEAISVEEAVRAMTIDAARQLRVEAVTGSLEVGKDADLVVLGRDLFAIPSHDIAATPVLMTMRAGRVTYDGLG